MKSIKNILFFIVLVSGFNCKENTKAPQVIPSAEKKKPTVSFTFDDGATNDIVNFKFEEWNNLILSALEDANLKAIFFVTGINKRDKKGEFLLEEWDKRNHKIANHTFSHPNFNDKNNTLDIFSDELQRADAVIKNYKNYVKLFRFPYLKEGKSKEKVDGIRSIMKKNNYRNGHVTIDASDWYVNSRLIKQMRSQKKVDTLAFQEFYLNHIIDRAKFYESLSYEMNGRHINHTLVLHHNLTSALFLKSLIKKFKSEGWEVIDAMEAYKDPIYNNTPNVVPAGESLIWSLAKESGKYEDILRYPAEDSRYEKAEMDKLNL